jgi:hypothetical protein
MNVIFSFEGYNNIHEDTLFQCLLDIKYYFHIIF